MRSKWCIVSGVVLTGIIAAAAVAAAPLPSVVAKAVQDIAAVCTESGGKGLIGETVKRVDLNGDGHEDYVLDVGAINCDGAASVFGDREKGVLVYAGDGKGGARQVFNDMSYGTRIEGTGPSARLWLTVSGAACGKKPAADFASEAFCDRAIAWNPKTQVFDYAPVSTVKMIE